MTSHTMQVRGAKLRMRHEVLIVSDIAHAAVGILFDETDLRK